MQTEYEEFDMTQGDSSKKRAIVKQYSEGVEVIISARKSLLVNFVLTLWMVGWAYGEASILSKFVHASSQSPDAILVFWIVGWTLGGLFAVFMWLWNNRGREIIRISEHELKHFREYVYFSRSRNYETGLISNLRLNLRSGIPYQTLISLYLRDCAAKERKLDMKWK